jgi:hypothetical protein
MTSHHLSLLSLLREDNFMRRVSREIGTRGGALVLALLSFKLSTILERWAIATHFTLFLDSLSHHVPWLR